MGEEAAVYLGRFDLAVPIWWATWTSAAPEAMTREAQTCRSSCALVAPASEGTVHAMSDRGEIELIDNAHDP
jgi:hypothetical protein